MRKLNLEEQIPGVLWVDKPNGAFIYRYGHGSFCAGTKDDNSYFQNRKDAESFLETLLPRTLDEQDQEWVKRFKSADTRGTALMGIAHERERVRGIISDAYFDKAFGGGLPHASLIRKHLGLDSP